MTVEHIQSREVKIERILNVARKRLWESWTYPEIVAGWWEPRGVTCPTCEIDAKQGGKINFVMLAGAELGPVAGQEWPLVGTFREVVQERKLVFTGEASDEVQKLYFNLEITVEFEDLGQKTRMRLQINITEINKSDRAESAIKGMEKGWQQTLEKLGELLEN